MGIIYLFLCPMYQNTFCQIYPVSGITNLSGPRLGSTLIRGETAEIMKEDYDAVPFVTQFGWQFETRFFTVESGITGVTEWVILVGGFEQEKFLPSLSWLIGIRTARGFEFGAVKIRN